MNTNRTAHYIGCEYKSGDCKCDAMEREKSDARRQTEALESIAESLAYMTKAVR